jgi:hypothetical protein
MRIRALHSVRIALTGRKSYSWRIRCDGLRPQGSATTTTHMASIASPRNSKTNSSTTSLPKDCETCRGQIEGLLILVVTGAWAGRMVHEGLTRAASTAHGLVHPYQVYRAAALPTTQRRVLEISQATLPPSAEPLRRATSPAPVSRAATGPPGAPFTPNRPAAASGMSRMPCVRCPIVRLGEASRWLGYARCVGSIRRQAELLRGISDRFRLL